MRLRSFAFILFYFVYIGALLGQSHFIGQIQDSTTKLPIHLATIKIKSIENGTVLGILSSNQNGTFSIRQKLLVNNYLEISHISYKRAIVKNLQTNRLTDTLKISIVFNTINLENVEIKNRKDFLILKGDTLEYDVSNLKYRRFADADELALQISGMKINSDGRLIINGEEITKITVDGRPFFTSDPLSALKMLPAEALQSIQIINASKEEATIMGFDSGEKHKELNVILKEDMKKGMFSKIYLGLGLKKTKNVGTSINFFSPKNRISFYNNNNNIGITNGISQITDLSSNMLNSSEGLKNNNQIAANANFALNNKIDIDAELKTSTASVNLEKTTNTIFFSNAMLNQLRTDSIISFTRNNQHLLTFRISSNKDHYKKINFLISPQVTLGNNIMNSHLNSKLSKDDETLNSSSNTNYSENDNLSINGSAMMGLIIGKKNKMGFNIVKTENSSNGQNQMASNSTYLVDKGPIEEIFTFQNSNISKAKILLGKITYNRNINSHSDLQFAYTYSNETNHNKLDVNKMKDANNLEFQFDSTLSSNFTSSTRLNNATLNYKFKKGILDIVLGAGFETNMLSNYDVMTQSQSRTKFKNFLPSATANISINQTSQIMLAFNTTYLSPSSTLLQEVSRIQNPLEIISGNKNLIQEIRKNWNLSYRKVYPKNGSSLFINANFSNTDNKFVNSTQIVENDSTLSNGITIGKGARLLMPKNVNSESLLNINSNINIPIFDQAFSLEYDQTITYTRTPVLINQSKFYSRHFSQNANISIIRRTPIFNTNLTYSYTRNNSGGDVAGLSLTSYNQHNLSSTFRYYFKYNIFLSSNLNYRRTSSFIGEKPTSLFLWNMSLDIGVFKNRKGNLSLTIFDILDKNRSDIRSITDLYNQYSRSNTMSRYVMLTFSYNLRKFGI